MFFRKTGYMMCIILLVIVLTSCKDAETKPNNEDVSSNDNVVKKTINLSDYRGIWGSETEDSIEVFNVADNMLNINYHRYRIGSFSFENVEFGENGIGKCKYSNEWISAGGITRSYEVEGYVYLGERSITIKVDMCNVPYFENSWENTFNINKEEYRFTTEKEINDKIQQAIESEFKNIDNDILNVVKDGEKYITLKVNGNCLIASDTSYGKDFKFYNIDKKAKKIITVYDFLDNDDRKIKSVKDYINQEILRKTQEDIKQNNDSYIEPHWHFDEYYFEEQFVVNEENKSLDIKCPYPDEANKSYGLLTVEVPFDVFDKAESVDILYNGYLMSNEIKRQTYHNENNSQYERLKKNTYYNYENNAFVGITQGKDGESVFFEITPVGNVGKIAISSGYNAIPRNVTRTREIPKSLESKLQLAQNQKFEALVIDLDGDGAKETIVNIWEEGNQFNKSEITLYSSNGENIGRLANGNMVNQNWESDDNRKSGVITLNCIEIIDIDNDNNMEIIVDVPSYELHGGYEITVLKYDGQKLIGDSDVTYIGA